MYGPIDDVPVHGGGEVENPSSFHIPRLNVVVTGDMEPVAILLTPDVRNGEYSCNAVLFVPVSMAVSRDYPKSLDKFEEAENKLNEIYGNPDDRGYILTNFEADQRRQNTLILDKDMGHGKIDEASAYTPGSQPDGIDFADWGED